MTPLAYTISRNCLGLAEIPGQKEHPAIRWAFDLAGLPSAHDDTEAWCGAWQALTAHLAGDPIPKLPARARSWLTIGKVIGLSEAMEGDTVILKRGEGPQPGPDVLDAQGHVGRLVSYQPVAFTVNVLAGNQGNKVSIDTFPAGRILGLRRPA
jgi:hypothetical protein